MNEPWGSYSKTLRFPFAEISFVGISEKQVVNLEKGFQSFTESIPDQKSSHGLRLQCEPYKRTRPLPFSIDELSVNDWYMPRCIKHNNQLEVYGFNFSSNINFNQTPICADIGIAEESDLADPNIIENFLRIYAAHASVKMGGGLLHSAGIVVENRALIFVGRSGVGKSTLSKKAYEVGAGILSDDMNLVLEEQEKYFVHAVPFTGEYGKSIEAITGQKRYPVRGIGLLQQGDKLEVRRENNAVSVSKLYAGSPFVNFMDDTSDAILFNLEKMAREIPIYNVVSRRNDCFNDIISAIAKFED